MTQMNTPQSSAGRIILFGSGEMSPTGRKIHESVIKQSKFSAPVKIGILDTPTGFEVNALHGWGDRMQQFFEKGLRNYHPAVTRIHALRRDGVHSTNSPAIVEPILSQDYLYCGAGSPGYTVLHLKDSLAYQYLCQAHETGCVLCFGSATAVAISVLAIPVYEIFKVGEDIHWLKGMDFFSRYGMNLSIVPHWNNAEGENFDTTRCYMGTERFNRLLGMLPQDTVVLGIDELTACMFDPIKEEIEVMGIGSAHIIKNGQQKDFVSGISFGFNELSLF